MMTMIATWQETLTNWNPTTFYLLATGVQTIVIYVTYAFLGAESDYNTWMTALLGAAIANGTAYGLRGYEVLIGVLGTTFVYLFVLVAFSNVDMIRSIGVFVAIVVSYLALVYGVVPRTSLESRELGGFPQAAHQGGLEKAPIERSPALEDE